MGSKSHAYSPSVKKTERKRCLVIFLYLVIEEPWKGERMAVEQANLQFHPYMDCLPLKFSTPQIKTTSFNNSDFQSSHIFVRFSDFTQNFCQPKQKIKSTLISLSAVSSLLQRLSVFFERNCSWTHTFCSIPHVPILSRVSLPQCKTAAIDSQPVYMPPSSISSKHLL